MILLYILISIILLLCIFSYVNKNNFLNNQKTAYKVSLSFMLIGLVFAIVSGLVLFVNNYWESGANFVFGLSFMALFILKILIKNNENHHANLFINTLIATNLFVFASNKQFLESYILITVLLILFITEQLIRVQARD